jgi:predicted lipoprotein with Yx(FWY)xxD motif
MRFASSLVLIAAILLSSVSASAGWVKNGIPLTATPGVTEYWSRVVSDGAGGVIVVWSVEASNLYAQRIDGYGRELWQAGGVSLCTAPGERWDAWLTTDGAGGAIVAWMDFRNGNPDVYAQRVRADGVVLWAAGGVPVCTQSADQQYYKIVADGAGGAIVAWQDYRNGSYDIYAQRVSAIGAVQWTLNGVVVCAAAAEQSDIAMLERPAGGAFVTWSDFRGGIVDVYYQIVHPDGSTAYGPDASSLTSGSGNQGYARLAPDGVGGAIIAWTNRTVDSGNIQAQRIDQDGIMVWASGGVPVCQAAREQTGARVVSDGEHGAIIAWLDSRNSVTLTDFYAQRLNARGIAQWTTDGVPLCSGDWRKEAPDCVSDGRGGAIFTWVDYRYDSHGVFCQKIDDGGGTPWGPCGVDVCVADGTRYLPTLICDGDAGAIVTWADNRAADAEIYAERIERSGFWGYPCPAIADVRDVPGDQGGFVDVAWDASRLDDWHDPLVYFYSVWRAISHTGAIALSDDGAALIDDPSKIDPASKTPVIRVERAGATTYYWKLVSTVYASYLASYSDTASTLFDSSGVSTGYHYFQVIAHGNYGDQFWTSLPDSGYSVDNLGPSIPLGLAGVQEYAPTGLALAWHPNGEIDLKSYAVYRGLSPGFVPSPANRVASPTDTLWFDGAWRWNGGFYYKVSALDIHGNESGHALLGPDGVTGNDTPKAPEAAYLRQNYPNPFNPTTRIAFGLSVPGRASLRIYDAAGRLVRVLVEGARPAGAYAETWDGRDSRGAAVASGIYFYRLAAPGFDETKKMAIMR